MSRQVPPSPNPQSSGRGLIACRECDLLQRDPLPGRGMASDAPRPAREVCCSRCGARIYRISGVSLNRSLALALTASIVFLVANAFPIAVIDAHGNRNESTLLGAVGLLWQQDMAPIALLVLITTVMVPALELSLLTTVLLHLRLGRPLESLSRLPAIHRLLLYTRPWGMTEVFVLGVLVSLVKLSHLASLTVGVALWAYGALMLLLAALFASLDVEGLLGRMPMPLPMAETASPPTAAPTASGMNLVSCHVCGLLAPKAAVSGKCGRCGTTLRERIPASLSGAGALTLAAAILFIPANMLPIMETGSLFGAQRDTILSGVVFLWYSGSWPLALLVFVASILVPLFKLLALSLLLLSVRSGSSRFRHLRSRLYRMLELVGRWSMLDIYVVTILSALVQIHSLATIAVGPGAVAFGAVVVLTMLATLRLDPRLIWDAGVSEMEDGHA